MITTAPRCQPPATGRRVFILCALVAFLDGFDTQSIGPAAPAIARQTGLTPATMGPVFSASQLGFLVGALLFGAAGDRLGRKRILMLCTTLFALATLGTIFAPSYQTLMACRLIAGLGLGGASPNFVSLVCEFTHPDRRARLVTWLWAAVPLGGMAGSFASAALLPAVGWQAVFLIGAALPVPLVLAIARMMPESRESAGQHSAPASALFTDGRALPTALLWLASFMTWTTLVVTALWMPALLERAGWSPRAAATMLALNNGGGVVGTLLIGALIGRISAEGALRLVLAGAAVLIALMGLAVSSTSSFATAATLAGFCASAAGGAMLAVSASLYPPEIRSTAVGWALGFGRIGTVVGPAVVGLLAASAWSVSAIYLVIASLAATGALLVHLLGVAVRPRLAIA